MDDVEQLWGARARPSRGPKPGLSVEQITAAAIGIADAEGIAAVSMQRVAAELEFTKMSLYTYVSGKGALLALMVEAAAGEPPSLAEGDWRSTLEIWAQELRASWRLHPWLPQITTGSRSMGPNEIAWTECALAALSGTRLSGGEKMDAVFLISGFIRNVEAAMGTGTQPWTSNRQLNPAVTKLIRAQEDRFPALITAVSSNGDDQGDTWEFGLTRILDGLERLIKSRA